MTKKICLNCKYYDPLGYNQAGRYGRCRCNPPVSVVSVECEEVYGDQIGIWPLVHEEDWCGKFVNEKEEKEKEARALKEKYIKDLIPLAKKT